LNAGTAHSDSVDASEVVVVIVVVVIWRHSRPTGVSVCASQAAHVRQRRLEGAVVEEAQGNGVAG